MRQPTAPRAPRAASPRGAGGAGGAGGSGSGDARGAGSARGADLVIPPEELADLHEDWTQADLADWDGYDEDEGPGDLDGPVGVVPAPSQLDVRIAERRRAARRVLWARIGIGAAVLAVLVGLGWLVGFSPVLSLRADRISVVGEGPYLNVDAAVAEAMPAVGTPLVRVDTAGIAAAIEDHPDVAGASVVRDWPRGVTITLTPREPVAVADSGSGRLDLVGPDGIVVTSVDPQDAGAELPLLTVDMTQDGAQGTALAVLSVLEELPAQLREQVGDAGATSPDAIELTLHSGATVAWGSARDSALKAEVLLTLLQVPAQRYDVSAPLAPTTT